MSATTIYEHLADQGVRCFQFENEGLSRRQGDRCWFYICPRWGTASHLDADAANNIMRDFSARQRDRVIARMKARWAAEEKARTPVYTSCEPNKDLGFAPDADPTDEAYMSVAQRDQNYQRRMR